MRPKANTITRKGWGPNHDAQRVTAIQLANGKRTNQCHAAPSCLAQRLATVLNCSLPLAWQSRFALGKLVNCFDLNTGDMSALLRYGDSQTQAEAIADNTATRYAYQGNMMIPDSMHISRLGKLLHQREFIYRERVLKGLGIKSATMHQLAVMDDVLTRGEMMSCCIGDLMNYGYYDYYAYKLPTLRAIFDDLAVRGILFKAVRPAYANAKRKRTVVVFGMTDKARALLDEYYAWIGGAHDAEFVGKPVKVVRSHRGK